VKILTHIVNSIRSAANYNPEAESQPQCILWTDKDKLWEKVIIHLKEEMPELLIYGSYNPASHIGPAIWIKVAIAGLITDYTVPYGKIPIIYLPGISRQDLRAVEQCPNEIKPLAELQYRGVIWSQINSRDWTPFAYFKSKKGGLDLTVQQDDLTLQALERSLLKLMDEDVEELKHEILDKDFFNSLLAGGDLVRDILVWMNDSEGFKAKRSKEEWQAFVDICKSKFKFHPDQDGLYSAAEKLAWKDDSWNSVWDRFCEAPAKYHSIPKVLRNIVMPIGVTQERSPQWNDQQEVSLRKDLKALEGVAEHNARTKLIELETQHSIRGTYVWAEIGDAQLVEALYWLSQIAEMTKNKIVGTLSEICAKYESWGWKVDEAVTIALQSVKKQEDIEAVICAIRAIYISWIDENARNLQEVMKDHSYVKQTSGHKYKKNECIFFVDGLRFDMAKRLAEILSRNGYKIKESTCLAKLPTVTSTCKPSLTPVADQLIGEEVGNEDFSPVVRETKQTASAQRIESLMKQKGCNVLKNGDYSKNDSLHCWLEYGQIDGDGHNLGWHIVHSMDRYINEIVERIEEIFKVGWNSVKVVTDHGWLMVPKGLPKTSIAASLVDSKWGRCAAIKPGALFDGSYYPWFWNENVHFALAEGVSCYRASTEYSHGGISLQECILLDIEISLNSDENLNKEVLITDINWKGMRCKVAVEGKYEGLKLDLRMKPAMAESSIVMGRKAFNKDGISSVVVDDDSQEGKSVYLVLIEENGKVVSQTTTIVGGEQ
jgi:hypothetical protein